MRRLADAILFTCIVIALPIAMFAVGVVCSVKIILDPKPED
jgi:hypothetical protein